MIIFVYSLKIRVTFITFSKNNSNYSLYLLFKKYPLLFIDSGDSELVISIHLNNNADFINAPGIPSNELLMLIKKPYKIIKLVKGNFRGGSRRGKFLLPIYGGNICGLVHLGISH